MTPLTFNRAVVLRVKSFGQTDAPLAGLITSCLQAAANFISTEASAQLFWLSDSQAAVFAHEDGPKASPYFLGGLCCSAMECTKAQESIMQCFQTGKGLTYHEQGPGFVCETGRELGVFTRLGLVPNLKTIPGAAFLVLGLLVPFKGEPSYCSA